LNVADDRDITLVLAPGIDGTGLMFSPLLAALPSHIKTQVIRYPADARWTLRQYAQFLAGQMPAGRMVVLGESFSSIVVLELLAANLRPVEAAIFSAGFAEPPQPGRLWLTRIPILPSVLIACAPRRMVRRHLLGSSPTLQQIAVLASIQGHVQASTIAYRLRLVADRHAFAKQTIDMPCLYLQATEDRVVPGRCLSWFEKHCQSLAVEQFDSPHCLLQCKPRETATAIAGFIDRLRT
jgi:pimeloyl-ACP methyl ester carboxylesterase